MDKRLIEYLDDLKSVAEADDDRFPEFLFNFISNDYDEDYYSRGMLDSALTQKAKRIRRKYNNFFDYYDALEVYNQYMSYLAEKYGSAKIAKALARDGDIDEFVPPKPKLKNSKANRAVIESGLVPSRKVIETISGEDVLQHARKIIPTESSVDAMNSIAPSKPPKEMRKQFKEFSKESQERSRKNNIYRSGHNAEIDFIIDYINNANSGNYSSSMIKDQDMTISEIMDEHYHEIFTLPEILEDEMTATTRTIRNGRLTTSKDENLVEIMTMMYDMGVDVFGTYGKSMNKTSVKMVRNAIGDGPMTKKEKKEMKKRRKKEEKRLRNKRNNDKFLEQTLLNNRYSFSNNGGNQISLRLSDLIDN